MRRAIALSYDQDRHEAPIVVCAGEGDLAVRIERAALQHGVTVVRDVAVADALSEVRVGEQIPEALFEAIATILIEIRGWPEGNSRETSRRARPEGSGGAIRGFGA